MDVSLPGMDGWEVTRRLKAEAATRQIPVVALTAYAMVTDRDKALQAGCDDYETKPVDFQRLLAKIETLIGREVMRMTTRAASLLIVDDEELNRDMLSQRLELNGYTVTAVESGRQALGFPRSSCVRRCPAGCHDARPQWPGCLQALRRRYSVAELPIIMVTARDQGEDVVEAFGLGANDYVTKPIDLPVVLARIATQVSHKRAHAALRESEARYALAARGTNNGLWDWDLRNRRSFLLPALDGDARVRGGGVRHQPGRMASANPP